MFLTGLIRGLAPRHLETYLTSGNLFDIIHTFLDFLFVCCFCRAGGSCCLGWGWEVVFQAQSACHWCWLYLLCINIDLQPLFLLLSHVTLQLARMCEWKYLEPSHIPCAITLTLGNRVLLYAIVNCRSTGKFSGHLGQINAYSLLHKNR